MNPTSTAPPASLTCPDWCDYGTEDHGGDHWRTGDYVAATRSGPIDTGMGGATIPAIGAHLAKYQHDGTDVVLHIGAYGDESGRDDEVRLSLADAIAHAAQLLTAISVGLEGRPSGLSRRTETFQMLEKGVQEIVSAHRRTATTGASA